MPSSVFVIAAYKVNEFFKTFRADSIFSWLDRANCNSVAQSPSPTFSFAQINFKLILKRKQGLSIFTIDVKWVNMEIPYLPCSRGTTNCDFQNKDIYIRE